MRQMRMIRPGAALLLILALAVPATGPASAACRCVCFNGQMRSACNGPLDAPAICDRICPLSVSPPGAPPSVSGRVATDENDPAAENRLQGGLGSALGTAGR